MNFRVTVRDNNAGSGGAADAAMTVTIDGATGPFRVTAPNTNVNWQASSTQTVTWDVNGSNANAANVKISLSTDGGQTFPTTILATTPNDGTEQITVPNVTTAQARIKVEAVNNIFFDINDANFAITGGTTVPTVLGNISTRLRVLAGDNALIGGMIANGTGDKRVIIRAIGPSLTGFGVAGALANPTLDLFQGSTLLMSNDDWQTSAQQAEIAATGLAPGNAAESAIIWTLTPGQNYTAAVRGSNNTTGVGVVEAFDLNPGAASKLGNISTRGFVDVDDNVMIAGLIATPANGTNLKILVRALGPTLTGFGVPNALANPTLDLVNSSGTVLRSNNDWKDDPQQRTLIEAAGLAPGNDAEAALVETVAPGAYTAVVRGSNRTTGVALVEAYNIP
jgi:hypothetical protein